MPAPTNVPTHATSEILAVTDWNAAANNSNFFANIPQGRLYQTGTGTTVGSGTTNTVIGFSNTDYMLNGMTNASNYIQVPYAGLYLIIGQITWASFSAGDGLCYAGIFSGVGGGVVALGDGGNVTSGSFPLRQVVLERRCSAGEQLQLVANQNSGSNQSLQNNQGPAGNWLSVTWRSN